MRSGRRQHRSRQKRQSPIVMVPQALGPTDLALAADALRAYAGRGLRRAFGVHVPRLADLRSAFFDLKIMTRNALAFWPSENERTARVLALDFGYLHGEHPGRPLTFRASDVAAVLDALRHFADRRVRRARAVAWACLFAAVVAMGARDGNCNGRADVLDLAAAAREISGFGTGMPAEVARRTAAPRAVRRG